MIFYAEKCTGYTNKKCTQKKKKKEKRIELYKYLIYSCRVCNSKYEPTAMNHFMRSVKHLTQVLTVGVYCVDQSRKFADSDVMKNLHFRSNCGH